MLLGDVATGRDNNFNLIRITAAFAVLVSHAWPVALGRGTAEPLQQVTGHSLGTLAVYVFFVTSGFLIAASFEHARSHADFIAARVLRIFPGLCVSLIVVAFGLGTLATSLPLSDYLGDNRTWAFLAHNMNMLKLQYTLPGVFEHNPYPTVEGSIWTLVHEMTCYALLFLGGIAGLLRHRRTFALVLAAAAALWAAIWLTGMPLPPRLSGLYDLAPPFALGTAAWVWRDRLRLRGDALLGLLVLAALMRGKPAAFPALILALGYGTLWLAYVPGGMIRRYGAVGDYSYGLYIYAFPLQGLVVWAMGPMLPLTNIALALPVTLTAAILSWHLIEKPALALRQIHLRQPQKSG